MSRLARLIMAETVQAIAVRLQHLPNGTIALQQRTGIAPRQQNLGRSMTDLANRFIIVRSDGISDRLENFG